MTTREIPALKLLILKAIAKKPSIHLSSEAVKRFSSFPKLNDYDITQDLINFVTDAGRLTDEAFPIELISSERTYLSICNTKLSAKYFLALFNRCSKLVTLDVSGSFQVDDESVKYMIEKCVNLKSLRIRNCRKTTSNVLKYIVALNRNLSEIDIGGNFNIDIKGVDEFISTYQYIDQIESFYLSGLIIKDSTASLIIKKCKSLRCLGIAYADISDQSLIRLIQSVGQNIKHLNVSWMSTTTSPSHNQIESERLMALIITNCPVLEELDISGTKSVTLNDLLNLIESLNQKAQTELNTRHALRLVHAKFIASSKSQMESVLSSTFPHIKFIL